MSIENKLDEIAKDINVIKVTLGEQHVSLVDHIRRTELLEKELEPLKTHMNSQKGVRKFILWISAVAAGIAGVLALKK